jgi:hypothetical protein
VNRPTPLLEFFKRGEVARDVRLLAAQGALAPGVHEQLSILVLLLEDQDPEIRRTADRTLNRIPVAALQAFLTRSDVSVALREFFADRGVFPDETPPLELPDSDLTLVESSDNSVDVGDADSAQAAVSKEDADTNDNVESKETVVQRIAAMSFTERLKAALKGTREMRSILIRDTNKMIAAAVLSSPRLTEQEVESFARMANVSDDVLRTIGSNRSWTKSYSVILALAKNPKTPIAMSMNILARLSDRDLSMVSVDRNVPDVLRAAARRKVVAGASRK